jgi:pimeloyl-ACP methyl ester carboxylesterase
MIPFLLYADRHENVRWFMDAYTDHLAGMPCLERVDYVGHSNGTYILASALQHYKTLEVNRVYFAGSVVPKHYPWIELGARVKEVNNVVASDDWVVALFPRLFEQVAEWLGTKPVDGPLDIGSAGFRGFDDGADGSGKVRNIKYATGSHGAGVDVTKAKKLGALVDFVLADKALDLTGAFVEAQNPRGALSFFSNISWAVWLVLASALAAIAWLFWHWRAIRIPFTARTFRLGRAPFVIFVGVVGLLFFSI